MTATDTNTMSPVKYGSWTLVGPADGALRKIFVARCECGCVQKISAEALTSGSGTSSGCRPPPAAARAEFEGHRRRKVIEDWLPERGR